MEKCKVIHLGHNNRQTKYNMGQTELQMSSVEKDLRGFVDDRLNFKKHVDGEIPKASDSKFLKNIFYIEINT